MTNDIPIINIILLNTNVVQLPLNIKIMGDVSVFKESPSNKKVKYKSKNLIMIMDVRIIYFMCNHFDFGEELLPQN